MFGLQDYRLPDFLIDQVPMQSKLSECNFHWSKKEPLILKTLINVCWKCVQENGLSFLRIPGIPIQAYFHFSFSNSVIRNSCTLYFSISLLLKLCIFLFLHSRISLLLLSLEHSIQPSFSDNIIPFQNPCCTFLPRKKGLNKYILFGISLYISCKRRLKKLL